MTHQDGEIRDVPFLSNDMKDELPTTGKPLDPADGLGKADAELFQEGLDRFVDRLADHGN